VELELCVSGEEAADDDCAADMGRVDQAYCAWQHHEQRQAAGVGVEAGERQRERGLACGCYVDLDWLAFLLRTWYGFGLT